MNPKIPVCAALLGAFTVAQPYRLFVVSGESMDPTFHTGEVVVGELRPHQIARGDVVVFHHGSETMVKRVAFLSGDTVERFRFVDEWQVANTPLARAALIKRGCPRQEIVVPEGQFYALSDNLPGSIDSRTYGTVPLRNVVAVLPKWSNPAMPTIAAKKGKTLVAQF